MSIPGVEKSLNSQARLAVCSLGMMVWDVLSHGVMKPMRADNRWAFLILLFGWTNVAAVEGIEGTEEYVLSRQTALPGGTGPTWRTYVSPSALVTTRDGKRLFIACATANRVATFDTALAKVIQCLEVVPCPLGLALSQD